MIRLLEKSSIKLKKFENITKMNFFNNEKMAVILSKVCLWHDAKFNTQTIVWVFIFCSQLKILYLHLYEFSLWDFQKGKILRSDLILIFWNKIFVFSIKYESLEKTNYSKFTSFLVKKWWFKDLFLLLLWLFVLLRVSTIKLKKLMFFKLRVSLWN